jgi:tetratricopeptide (TPR) repeat protein
MKRAIFITGVGLLLGAAAIAGAVYVALSPERRDDGAPVSRGELVWLRSRLAKLERSQEEMRVRLAALEMPGSAPGPRPADASREEAPPRSGESESAIAEPETAARAAAAEAEAAGDAVLEAALGTLFDPGASYEKKVGIWQDLTKQGLLDRAIAVFEARAEDNPQNPDAQCELGGAYLQKVVAVNDVQKGPWAMKADQAFDKALAINPEHWDARFTKAMSYTFWPAFLGMQPKAIEHLETLRTQQEARAPEPKHEQTYVVLGNLYANQGQTEKARGVWQRGSELFPQSKELQARLAETAGKREPPGGELDRGARGASPP